MDRSPRSRAKTFLFATVFWLLLLLVPLLALETIVRAIGWQAPIDPYIHFGRTVSFFEDVKIDGVDSKQVKARELYREREVSFATRKPPDTFRIFCIGSSASAGWPHPDTEIYSAYLEQALASAYPSLEIEVINVSAHAYAAYRNRLILQEVLQFEPDLLIVYTGNNEFIEPRLYATMARWYEPLETLAKHSTVYRLIRGSSRVAELFPANTFRSDLRGNVAYEQWSKIDKLPLVLRTDPGQFEKVVQHYDFSVTSMVRAAQEKGTQVILLTVPVNLRTWQPNVSVVSVQGEKEKAWRKEYSAGRASLLRGDAELAAAAFARAAAIDSSHAATQYYLGRALETAGRLDEAYGAFERARDLDASPFRATSHLNNVIRRIGGSFGNVTMIDMEAVFRDAVHPHAPGFDLFLDYVHPTKKGNLLIAQKIFDAISASGRLGPAGTPFRHVPATQDDGTEYDATKDQDLQRILFMLAMMMHQNETVVALGERIVASPGGIEGLGEQRAHIVVTALELFREVVKLEQRELLEGEVPQTEKDKLASRLADFFRTTFGNYQEYLEQRKRSAGHLPIRPPAVTTGAR
jgi:tetratricopeptide (TPR) repeat protein